MKRRNVHNCYILGSVCEWPLDVDLSRNESTGIWTLYFRYTDPEAKHGYNQSAGSPEEMGPVLAEGNVEVSDFARSLERVASSMAPSREQENLAQLATALREIPPEDCW